MKIVIDIPEDRYETLKMLSENRAFYLDFYQRLVVNGTPLPKGHGRLIDADSMKTMKNIQSANFNAIELIRFWIDNQPTIIEADKEGAEE